MTLSRPAAQMPDDPPFAASTPPLRDGTGVLERMACYKLATTVASLEPSWIVALLLYPQTMADWAREESVTPALVYNLLSTGEPPPGVKRKPLAPIREKLARRLGIPRRELDRLLDRTRPVPANVLPVQPPPDWQPLPARPARSD